MQQDELFDSVFDFARKFYCEDSPEIKSRRMVQIVLPPFQPEMSG